MFNGVSNLKQNTHFRFSSLYVNTQMVTLVWRTVTGEFMSLGPRCHNFLLFLFSGKINIKIR